MFARKTSLSIVFTVASLTTAAARASDWQADPATPGDWATAANWTAGVPQINTGATINNGGTAVITTSAAAEVVHLGHGAGTSGNILLSDGSLQSSGEYIGYDSLGSFTQTGGTNTVTGSVTIANVHSATGSYSLSGTGVLTANNIFFGKGAATFNISGGSVTVNSSLGIVTDSGFSSPNTVTLSGGSLTVSTLTVNNGMLVHTGGTLNVTTLNGNGFLQLDAPASINTLNLNVGYLSGHGTISGDVRANLTSSVVTIAPSRNLPASETGTLTMNSLTITSNAILSFRLGTPDDSDALHVTNSNGLTLNGGAIALTDNAAPQGYYKLIQYDGAIQGSGSASLTLPAAPANFAYYLDTQHDPGFIDLHKVLLGDINQDNVVDGADFDTWFTHLQSSNPTYADGDLNTDGQIDGADYDLWFTHLQNTFGGDPSLSNLQFQISNASPVPEPASALLLLPLVTFLRPRRKSSSAPPPPHQHH